MYCNTLLRKLSTLEKEMDRNILHVNEQREFFIQYQ